ncbi:MAG: hypothetical protein AAGG80_05210 [Pseudomonadota bacterium]
MIKIIEYALIADDVYSSRSNFKKYEKKHSHDLILDQWYAIMDLAPIQYQRHICHAALYIKFLKNFAIDAIVAIRGTDNLYDVSVDFHSWFSDAMSRGKFDHVPSYYVAAYLFFLRARDFLNQHFARVNLSLTGHSLGGALAQLIVGLGHKPYVAVTFNAPGIGHIPGVDTNMSQYVYGINSRYGLINKIGKSFGHIEYIDVPNEEAAAKKAFQILAIEQRDEQKFLHTKDAIDKIFLNNLIMSEAMQARNDFLVSVYPQHSIKNLIAALRNNLYIANEVLS